MTYLTTRSISKQSCRRPASSQQPTIYVARVHLCDCRGVRALAFVVASRDCRKRQNPTFTANANSVTTVKCKRGYTTTAAKRARIATCRSKTLDSNRQRHAFTGARQELTICISSTTKPASTSTGGTPTCAIPSTRFSYAVETTMEESSPREYQPYSEMTFGLTANSLSRPTTVSDCYFSARRGKVLTGTTASNADFPRYSAPATKGENPLQPIKSILDYCLKTRTLPAIHRGTWSGWPVTPGVGVPPCFIHVCPVDRPILCLDPDSRRLAGRSISQQFHTSQVPPLQPTAQFVGNHCPTPPRADRNVADQTLECAISGSS